MHQPRVDGVRNGVRACFDECFFGKQHDAPGLLAGVPDAIIHELSVFTSQRLDAARDDGMQFVGVLDSLPAHVCNRGMGTIRRATNIGAKEVAVASRTAVRLCSFRLINPYGPERASVGNTGACVAHQDQLRAIVETCNPADETERDLLNTEVRGARVTGGCLCESSVRMSGVASAALILFLESGLDLVIWGGGAFDFNVSIAPSLLPSSTNRSLVITTPEKGGVLASGRRADALRQAILCGRSLQGVSGEEDGFGDVCFLDFEILLLRISTEPQYPDQSFSTELYIDVADKP